MITTTEASSISHTGAVEMEVISAIHSFHAALIDADRISLESLLDKELSYGHSNGIIENKDQFIENIVNGNSVFVEIELSEQTIKVSGNNAIVCHVFSAKTNDNNVPASIVLIVLLVLKKENEQWKLRVRQAVKAINENDFVNKPS